MALEQVRRHGGEAPPMLVTVGDGWPLGILGLVAGRLADEFQRPAFVISRDERECRGSGRGPQGSLDLGLLLAGCAPLFKRVGGHAQAAGLTVPSANLPDLLAYLNLQGSDDVAASARVDDAGQGVGGSEGDADEERNDHALMVDCRLPLRRLVPEVFAAIRSLEPYGTGFPEPTFLSPRVQIVSCWRSGAEGRTLRLRLREEAPGRPAIERVAIWPRRGELGAAITQMLPSLPPIALVYTLSGLHSSPPDGAPRILTLTRAADATVP
jgi:single-stranded-DNA-specific exonuclease